MNIHPDLNCRYQNRVLIIYTLCTAALTPSVLVPLQLHKDKPSFPSSSSVCTPKSRIYMMKALSDRSAMFFMYVIYTMALLMKCMLSFNNYQSSMEQQEHVNIRKFQINQSIKEKSKCIGWLVPPHQLTVSRTHDDPCSALLGYLLTKNDCRHLKHYNTHQNKQTPRFLHHPKISEL